MSASLVGQRVLLTRGLEDNAAWAARLRDLGAEVLELECIRCEPLESARAELAAALPRAAWVVFGSRRGVDALAELGGALPPETRVACVGPASAARARERLGRADFAPRGGTARALGGELALAHPPARALLAVAEGAGHVLSLALARAGWTCDAVAVYRTTPAPPESPRRALEVDLALLASPSAVAGLVARATLVPGARVLTIGPTTTAAARAHGLEVAGEARTRDLDGMLAAARSERT